MPLKYSLFALYNVWKEQPVLTRTFFTHSNISQYDLQLNKYIVSNDDSSWIRFIE